MELMYGTAWKEDDTKRCVLDALRAGFRAIDTANQRKHYYEAGVGDALLAAYQEKIVRREELFLQTKYTYKAGQDHRLPYEPTADYPTQVRQSLASSLEHLHTDYLDSYVLHGPSVGRSLGEADFAVWETMQRLHDEGLVKNLGVSNVNLEQLELLCSKARVKPRFVQNRCITFGWDKGIREFCQSHGIGYQGFNLLRNPVYDSTVFRDIVARADRTFAQVIYRFALQKGMIVLTGTTDAQHMREALAVRDFRLSDEDCDAIERLLE